MTGNFTFWFFSHDTPTPHDARVAAGVDYPGSLKFRRHAISMLPHTLIFGPDQGVYSHGNRGSKFHEKRVFCLESSGLLKWQEKRLDIQGTVKDLGCQESIEREEEEGAYKGKKASSNINLLFLGAFLWGSDYVTS